MKTRRRAIIIHENGYVTLADGENPGSMKGLNGFDLDKAMQNGAGAAGQPVPIGSGKSLLLMIDEPIKD